MDEKNLTKQDATKEYPTVLELDGVYYRVNRNSEWVNRCFSDLTKAEQEAFLSSLSGDGLKRLCCVLSETLRTVASVALSLELQLQINAGLEQAQAGKLIPGEEVFAKFKKKYGVGTDEKKV